MRAGVAMGADLTRLSDNEVAAALGTVMHKWEPASTGFRFSIQMEDLPKDAAHVLRGW